MPAFLPILAQALPLRWQAPWMLPLVLALGAALAAAVLWLYPGQVRRVRGPWRFVIPGLRLLAFTALAISVARPVALRARPPEDRGALLVLVDRSRSMSVADHGRSPAELVALADALGLLPAGVRAAASASVAADFERLEAAVGQAARAQGDLDYARVSGRGIEAAEARVRKGVDDARGLGRDLAARAAALPAGGAAAGDRLRSLGDLPPADPRGGWVATTRGRLAQAAVAIRGFQEAADRRLYDANADVRGVCDQLRQRTRAELAAEVLVRPGGLLDRLGADTPALVFAFADRLWPVGSARPADPAATRPAAPPRPDPADDPDPPTADPPSGPVAWTSPLLDLPPPDAVRADVPGAVAAALAAADGRPVRGVLVIGDGQQVGGGASAGAVPVLPPGVPLIAVAAAAAAPPPDVSVVDVACPPSAFAGETILVRARVRGTGGLAADPAALRLSLAAAGAAGDPAAAADLAPTVVDRPAGKKDDGTGWAQFAVRLDQPGVAELTVAAAAVPGEASAENNAARRSVKVLPERVRVAAYAGSAGWDFQYLAAALGRRPWFTVEAAVLDPAKPRVPLAAADILRHDVLVLYDLPAAALDRDQWYAADRLVHQQGGSVIVVAGPGFSPAGYADQPLAAALLPFNLLQEKRPAWRTGAGDRPSVRLAPGPEFARSDLLRLDDADANNARWRDLPGVWRVLPVRAAKPAARTIVRDAETGQAVATEMRLGAGRAFYVGTHETWRWRPRVGEAAHERFWRQLVRHAAEEPYAARAGRLSLDLDRVVAAPGEPVQVRVRTHPEDVPGPDGRPGTRPAAAAAAAAESLRVAVYEGATGPAGAPVRIASLSESPDGAGRLRATLDDLPAGRYVVRLTSAAPAPADAEWPQLPLRVEPAIEAEMRNLAGDPDRLRQMAESTGGRLLQLHQFAAVPGLLAAAADDRPRVVEWSLWDSPWLFAFVVACLGAEWALRKRAGLA